MTEEEGQSPKMLQLVDAWLDILIDKFHDALDFYEIGKLDGELWKSIVGHVIQSNGDVNSVIVKFMQYGRFVDMGVGRGMTKGYKSELGASNFARNRNDQGQLHKFNRKAKPWYSKTKYREIARLREIMAGTMSNQALAEIENALNNYTIIQ
ncbi:hypothetical protein ACTJKN_05125 [Pedobacter sp. 22163]|uniref:hypothetical protein n=1 Tax=Pedobacter sp. 22163 TaxID=3453883 RepID=UPI003F8762EA